MSNWTLHALKGIDEKGEPILTDLSTRQQKRARWYEQALEKAANSNVPKPIFSGYHVRAAIGPIKYRFAPAGNVEYGDHRGLHGEECAVAAYFARTNGQLDRYQPPILALVAGQPGNPATPCGNCRDILLQAFGDTLDIVSGAPEGGVAVVATLGQYLFQSFTPMEKIVNPLRDRALRTLRQGKSMEFDPYSSPKTLVKMPHYYAAIEVDTHPPHFQIGTNGRTESIGAIDLTADYDPVYPLRDAARGLTRRRLERVEIRRVIIVSEGEENAPPHVFYRDRGHLLEYHLRCEAATGKESNPPIYLFRVSGGRIAHAWKTRLKHWLTLPFSVKNFDPEFQKQFSAYCRSKENAV